MKLILRSILKEGIGEEVVEEIGLDVRVYLKKYSYISLCTSMVDS